jgi:NodT family efflux transporter outer membrane factor (OMF) lipoprotein
MDDRPAGIGDAQRPASSSGTPLRALAGMRPSGSRARSFPLVATLLFVAVLASGCTTSLSQWWHNGLKVGPNYQPPQAPVACGWLAANDPRVKAEGPMNCAWWTVFNDPALNRLIETAYRQNLDLRAAGTRILEARAQRNIAVGNLFPQSQSALGTYVHGQLSKNLALPLPPMIDLWATGFNASWELDFWGRYRRTIEATDADLGASIEGYNDALVLLLSEVATSYVQLRTFEERLQLARKNVELQTGSLKLADRRFAQGVATELDVHQARSSLAQTEALIPPLESGRRQASNRLCILLGMPVSDLATQLGPAPIPKAPVEVAVGIPADLLRRRPDVRQAELQVAAQCARIGVAEADLYPRFSINGFMGYAASDFKDLFASKSFLAVVAPNFQWNLLNYGRITNNVRAQDARFRTAVSQYQQTVLSAGREVEDALVAFVQSQQQAVWLDASVREASRSVELVVLQFQGGITDFNRVYTTQSTMVSQQDQLATTRGNIAISLIDAYRSLGGGWQYFVEKPATAAAPAEEIPPPAAGVERLPPPPEAAPADR